MGEQAVKRNPIPLPFGASPFDKGDNKFLYRFFDVKIGYESKNDKNNENKKSSQGFF
jgi:hypothetical protein